MIVCQCNVLTDHDFKEAAAKHDARGGDVNTCCQGTPQKQESEGCRLKKVYHKASGGRKPSCNGCYGAVLKLVAK